jgi:hypothetical protein
MTLVLEKLSAEVAITSELICHDKIRQHRKKDVEFKDYILFSLLARYQENEVMLLYGCFWKLAIYHGTVARNRQGTEIYFPIPRCRKPF